jgi:NAD(P)-dependent dehydrogenase (short-subunit alcohol dehydrogenase family)
MSFKTILVAGSSRGIGLAVAEIFSAAVWWNSTGLN